MKVMNLNMTLKEDEGDKKAFQCICCVGSLVGLKLKVCG